MSDLIPHISVIIPVYGCKIYLHQLYQRLVNALGSITENFEIIMVDDSSPDGAWKIIQELAAKDDRVRGIYFSRNFGQHIAISAGIDYVRGDWVVVMDADLQDVPEEIVNLYNKAQEGYEVVLARSVNR